MDFKSCRISFCDCTLRFVGALLWLAFLCAFSFYDLFDFMIHTSDHSISMEIVNEMQELKMIVANVGLIGMAYLDNMLSSMMTGKNNESLCQKLVMLVSIVVAIYLSLMSQGVDITKPNLRWENLPLILFVVFLCSLLIYKMQSLEVVHSEGKSF